MATKKLMWVFLGILVISCLVLGSAFQARAETMKCKVYTVAILNSFVLCLEALGKWQGVYLKAIGLYRSGEMEQKGLF